MKTTGGCHHTIFGDAGRTTCSLKRWISPRIVMALGGWSSYDTIEPYLAAPTEDNIIDSMSTAVLR